MTMLSLFMCSYVETTVRNLFHSHESFSWSILEFFMHMYDQFLLTWDEVLFILPQYVH